MEKGFHHESVGYWQTTGVPSFEILAAYPEGTIEVPLKPSGEHVWQNGVWVHAPPPESAPEEIRAAMAPLTARQLRLGLLDAGIAPSQVTAAIEAMPDGTDKERGRIEWEYATTFERPHHLIATIAAVLGLTDEQVDAMWTAALSL